MCLLGEGKMPRYCCASPEKVGGGGGGGDSNILFIRHVRLQFSSIMDMTDR